MADINTLTEQISGLSLLEASQLVKALETKLGISAAAPVAMAAAPAAAGGAAKPAEESTVTVTLLGGYPADKKVPLIKVVKDLLAMGLSDAKNLVEGAPKQLKADIAKKEADEIKAKIEAAGGKVEIK
jgi:large subunit ribosomal protein L7/L12